MRSEPLDLGGYLSARNLRVPAILLLALIAMQTGTAGAGGSAQQTSARPTYDSQSFLKELARLKVELESARKSTETLHSYRESIPATWAVDAGGRRYDVPTDLLVSRLSRAERQPKYATNGPGARLPDALAVETGSLSGQLPAPTNSSRAKLDRILVRSEYARTRQPSWWEKIRDRIYEVLFNALDRILSKVGGQKSLGYVLLWIVVCAAAVLIAYLISRGWFRTARREEMALQTAGTPSRSWQEWVFAAREAASRGEYRMANHCAYWAGITRLQDLGALAPDHSKTPREYLHALDKAKLILPEPLSSRQQALFMLTSRLEKVWYGYQSATEADFHDSLTQLETLGCHLP